MRLTKYFVFALITTYPICASAQDVVSKSAAVNQILERNGDSLTRGERDEIEGHLDAILRIANDDRNRRSIRDSLFLNGRQVTLAEQNGHLIAFTQGRSYDVNPSGAIKPGAPVYAAVFDGSIYAFVVGLDNKTYWTAINASMQPSPYVNTQGEVVRILSLEREGRDLVLRAVGVDNNQHTYSVLNRAWTTP
jgi:hypothetical protein